MNNIDRRPKPPSLAERALDAQRRMWDGGSSHADWELIRAALERLQELENNGCGLILPALDRLLEPESNG